MADEEIKTIVIDNGEYSCKGGLAGEETPDCEIRTIVGRRKYMAMNNTVKDIHIGDECYCGTPLVLKYPIERGIVTSWDAMENIWKYIFRSNLHVDPAEHPVMLTENIMTPKSDRERMIEIMFETFKVPSYCVSNQPTLSLYSSGRTTGIVAQLGQGISQIAPIYEGYAIPHAAFQYNFGGCDIDSFLQLIIEEEQSLRDDQYASSSKKNEIVRDIKEKHCYVALDYDAELQKAKSSNECNVSYTLPYGQVITITSGHFRAPELLFKPHMNGFAFDGIDQTIFDSIMKCDIDIRKDLYANIVLSGGTTMFEGLPERIEKEIILLAPPTMKIKIVAPPERKHAAWIGGSILASLATFPQMSITRKEYEESGKQFVHRKCL